MKLFKNNPIYGLVIFYVLAILYAFLISGRDAAGFKVFDLIFLNIESYGSYYLSEFDVVLYLLFILFLIVYAYYLNKNVFDDKSFYIMTINRYASKKKALKKRVIEVLKISFKLTLANVIFVLAIGLSLSLKIGDLIKVGVFLFKLALMMTALSVTIQKSIIDLDDKHKDHLIYLYMMILMFVDYFFKTNFLMYSGRVFKELLYLVLAVLVIIIECLLIKRRKV